MTEDVSNTMSTFNTKMNTKAGNVGDAYQAMAETLDDLDLTDMGDVMTFSTSMQMLETAFSNVSDGLKGAYDTSKSCMRNTK